MGPRNAARRRVESPCMMSPLNRHAILADFYAWWGAQEKLDPARADELARQLRAAALAHGAMSGHA